MGVEGGLPVAAAAAVRVGPLVADDAAETDDGAFTVAVVACRARTGRAG